MKPQTRRFAPNTSGLSPSPVQVARYKAHGRASNRRYLSTALCCVAILLLLAATGQKASAQQQYGFGYGGQNPPQAPPPYGYQQPQPQYAQPQYAQPAYPQQPQYGQQPYAPPAGQDYAYGDQPPGYAQQPSQPMQAPLSPDQLDQLLAPVALYPDSLLAQILTASTYPEQVAVANQWLQQMQAQGYGSPDQIANAVAGQDWDPSVKGLTAFPQVLSMMDQNLEWTTQLGNAYFNQPQDVMQSVQALRDRAQDAGTLQDTPQESVTDDQGDIELAPPTPDYVYVPAYDPWAVYGAPIDPYPGFSFGFMGDFFGAGLRFGPACAMAAFDRMPFGLLGWNLSWRGRAVFFHHSTYFTHSRSVGDWGYRHGGARAYAGWDHAGHWARGYRPGFGHQPIPYNHGAGFNRGSYERGDYGRSVPGGIRPGMPRPESRGYGNSFYGRNNYGRGTQQAYRQPGQQFSHPQTFGNYGRSGYSRPNYDNRAGQSFAPRPAYPGYRVPQSGYQRAYTQPSARSFAGEGRSNNEHAFGGGGFRPFGGGHESENFRAPKNFYGGGNAPRGFSHENFGHQNFGHESFGGHSFGGGGGHQSFGGGHQSFGGGHGSFGHGGGSHSGGGGHHR